MEKLNILLVCGSGASTGFMAANMRKAAKNRGIDASIIARSETEVEAYASEANYILLGPHLSYLEEEMKERVKDFQVGVMVMDKSYYATLNGDEALDDLIDVFDLDIE